MENVFFITYGDDKFFHSKQRILKEAQNFGFKMCTVYSPNDLDQEFVSRFAEILKQPRIGGYGIWRPYIIKKALANLKDGDYLAYIDAGCTINSYGMARFQEYLQLLANSEYGIISFQMPHAEKKYTTKEIFNYFQCSNEIKNSGQYLDGILIMKKCAHLEEIIDIWLKAVYEHPTMFTDIYNNSQADYFIDNRHEQSVFSVLRKKYGSVIIPQDETFDTVVPWGSPQSFKYPIWATRIRG